MFKSNNMLVLIAFVFMFSACSSNEIGESKDVTQDKIYQSYSINYTEGNANAEMYCQFRFAGKNGTTLVLNAPSQIQFDGEIIKVDSSDGSGAYYNIIRPINNFYGKHGFVFTNVDNKQFTNDFLFDSFKLTTVPASVSKKQDFIVSFETAALQPSDYIEISASNTDSSFSITHHATDGNAITIPAQELQRQKGKELMLEATLYRKITLQQNTAEGGQITVRYTLKPITVLLNN